MVSRWSAINAAALLLGIMLLVALGFRFFEPSDLPLDQEPPFTPPQLEVPLWARHPEWWNPPQPIPDESEMEEESNVVQLSYDDFDLVSRVVMAESGNQSLLGQMAVAQCIRTTMQETGSSAKEVLFAPRQYADPYRGEVSASVSYAVRRVFHGGENAVADEIRYFYSLATGRVSAWHESKTWVCTIGDHKFFK